MKHPFLLIMIQLNNMEKPRYSKEKKSVRNFRIVTKVQKVPMDVVSNYAIGEMIGVGGFAKVHKAYHRDTQEVVACKIIHIQDMSDHNAAKIRREIQIHSMLKHPNIVRIYEVVEKNDKIYIFMEYINNGQLFDFINKNGPIPQKFAIKIFSQILSAVCYLHDQDIAHRDIKPENIILDKKMNAKLIDFGLAKNLKNILQKSETICGSPSYCAPEIVRKEKDYDGKSIDVWCLAVTLYAMLEAALPFDDRQTKNLKSNIINFNYHPQRHSSQESQQFFQQVFQPAEYRPNSRDLFDIPLLTKYSIPSPYSLSPLLISKKRNSTNEHSRKTATLSTGQKKRTESLKNSMKMQTNRRKIKAYDLLKLKYEHIDVEDVQKDDNIFRRPVPIIPHKIRLREESPDSPRRILDYIKGYN